MAVNKQASGRHCRSAKCAAKENVSMQKKNSHAQAVEEFKTDIVRHLRRTIGTSPEKASNLAWWQALVATANEKIFERLTDTQHTHAQQDTRAVHYLSAEFLMGRLTINNLCNLEKYDIAS